jgi:hypothetical protein
MEFLNKHWIPGVKSGIIQLGPLFRRRLPAEHEVFRMARGSLLD